MKIIKIDKDKWADGIRALRDTYSVLGPLKKKDSYSFSLISDENLPDFKFKNTKLSPKSIVFPQSEIMMTYSTDDNIMKEYKKEDKEKVIFGVRPCDAKSFELVKMNFDTDEYKDPYWLNSYNATTFVGLACDDPEETCFCTSVGCSPYNEEGLDVLLAETDDGFTAKILTEKGDNLFKTAGWTDEGDDSVFETGKEKAEAKIVSKIDTDNLGNFETLDLYEAPFWEDISFACLNCGTCTFACPTCWCFDIQDEVKDKNGVRVRNWDSCMFPLFTKHTTGHNPRGTKMHRVRQRFMHKLKYFVDKYEKGTMCVGCGRCVRQCPVNIDIREVCDIMNSHVPAE